MSDFTLTTTCTMPFDDTVSNVREVLSDIGFGIITEIDMKATLADKIGAQIPDQLILGACNPRFAYEAIQADPKIAALLPCNVVVRSVDASTTVVDAFDPATMGQQASKESPKLADVAGQVRQLLATALEQLDSRSEARNEEN